MKNYQLYRFLLVLTIIGAPLNQADAQEQSSFKNTESLGSKNGTLLIIGGSASLMFYTKFMELVGGPDAPIAVIPTATSSNELSAEFLARFKMRFTNIGFKNVTVLHTRDRKEANSTEFMEPINNAKGVWFSGGRQWRHADSYLDTNTHEAFKKLLERGGVIA